MFLVNFCKNSKKHKFLYIFSQKKVVNSSVQYSLYTILYCLYFTPPKPIKGYIVRFDNFFPCSYCPEKYSFLPHWGDFPPFFHALTSDLISRSGSLSIFQAASIYISTLYNLSQVGNFVSVQAYRSVHLYSGGRRGHSFVFIRGYIYIMQNTMGRWGNSRGGKRKRGKNKRENGIKTG